MSENKLILEIHISLNVYTAVFLKRGDDVIWEWYFTQDDALFPILRVIRSLLETIDKDFRLVTKPRGEEE